MLSESTPSLENSTIEDVQTTEQKKISYQDLAAEFQDRLTDLDVEDELTTLTSMFSSKVSSDLETIQQATKSIVTKSGLSTKEVCKVITRFLKKNSTTSWLHRLVKATRIAVDHEAFLAIKDVDKVCMLGRLSETELESVATTSKIGSVNVFSCTRVELRDAIKDLKDKGKSDESDSALVNLNKMKSTCERWLENYLYEDLDLHTAVATLVKKFEKTIAEKVTLANQVSK